MQSARLLKSININYVFQIQWLGQMPSYDRLAPQGGGSKSLYCRARKCCRCFSYGSIGSKLLKVHKVKCVSFMNLTDVYLKCFDEHK